MTVDEWITPPHWVHCPGETEQGNVLHPAGWHESENCLITRRPSWNKYFLGICEAIAKRADCRRAQHGCVIVKDNRIISTGYNGSPSGGPSCLKGECPRGLLSNEECRSLSSYENCFALHAEQNAIAYADGRDTRGGTAYITGRACDMCGKLLVAAGIRRIVWIEAGTTKELLVNEDMKDGDS